MTILKTQAQDGKLVIPTEEIANHPDLENSDQTVINLKVDGIDLPDDNEELIDEIGHATQAFVRRIEGVLVLDVDTTKSVTPPAPEVPLMSEIELPAELLAAMPGIERHLVEKNKVQIASSKKWATSDTALSLFSQICLVRQGKGKGKIYVTGAKLRPELEPEVMEVAATDLVETVNQAGTPVQQLSSDGTLPTELVQEVEQAPLAPAQPVLTDQPAFQKKPNNSTDVKAILIAMVSFGIVPLVKYLKARSAAKKKQQNKWQSNRPKQPPRKLPKN